MKKLLLLLFALLLSPLSVLADQRIELTGSSFPLSGRQPIVWRTLEGQVWTFRPQIASGLYTVTIQNLNIANPYTYTLEAFQTADTLVSDYSNNAGRWTTAFVGFWTWPTSVTTFQFHQFYVSNAAQIAVRIRAIGGAALDTDTAFITITWTPNIVFQMSSTTGTLFPTVTGDTLGQYVQGTADEGVVFTAHNPFVIAGQNLTGSQVRIWKFSFDTPILTDSSPTGDNLTNRSLLMNADGFAAPISAALYGFDGTTTQADQIRTTSLANFPTSVTLTGRNLVGAMVHENGARWSVIASPAVSLQATASIAAETGVRHVCDCITFSAGSTTAPALTALKVNLRDGATGAGTIIWTYQVVIPAATGQNVEPHTICGLNLVGTTNTAMTLEFSAALTNLFQVVSISGFNVN